MILYKLLSPPNRSSTQTHRIHKLTEVVVIGEHENFVFTTFQVLLPYLKCLNNGQKLTVVIFLSNFVLGFKSIFMGCRLSGAMGLNNPQLDD